MSGDARVRGHASAQCTDTSVCMYIYVYYVPVCETCMYVCLHADVLVL